MAGFSSFLGHRDCRGDRWQVQVQKNSFFPNSPAFMFICRGNQANTTHVKESLEGDPKSGNHGVWAVYSVVKVRRTTFFNLPCVVSCLNEPRDFFTSALEPALPSLHSESQSNPRPCSLLERGGLGSNSSPSYFPQHWYWIAQRYLEGESNNLQYWLNSPLTKGFQSVSK